MKKFNWKLLLVVALALVLVISLFACNPKTDNNTPNTPDTPEKEPEIEYLEPERGDAQDVFFTELYNVANGIGNEKVPADKNVYLDLDLGLALGTRATTGEQAKAEKKFALGIALKAILDRQTGEGSQLSLGLTAGQATIANIYFTQQDHMAYVQIGDQKVKINTALVDLGSLLNNLLDNEMVIKSSSKAEDGTTTQIERYYYSLDELLTQLTGQMGHAWTIDNLLGVIFKHFRLADGVTDMIKGIKVAGLDVNTIFFDEEGDLSLKHALTAAPFQGLFVATNSGTHYEAKLGSVLTGALEPMLGAGKGVGDLNVKVSFDAEDHKLVAGKGVKISADFAVDEENTVYDAKTNGNPFVEVSINSLKVKEANAQTIAPADAANYSDNLQFQADVNLGLTGISIGMAPDETTPAKDLNLGLYANLDLGNVQNNKTQFRLFINFKNNPLHDKTEYDTNALDLIYKDGRLAMMVNNDAQLLGLPGVIGVNYGLVLAGSIGNMIDGILANYPTQKAIFDAEYWMPIQQKTYSYGEVNTDKTFNPNFKGFAIDGLDVSTILGLLGVNKAGTSEEAHTAAEDTNIYQTLLKVFNLLDFSKENTLAVGCDSVMDLLSDFVGMDAQGLKDMLNGIGTVGTLKNYLYVTGISPTDMETENSKVADLVPELLDAPLSVEIGVDGSIKLAIHLTNNKPEETETFDNHGAHIDATATIKLSAEKQPIEQFDLTELINTFKAVEADINAAAEAQATAQATWDKFVAEFIPKYAELEEAYKATEEFKTYSEVSSAFSEAKTKNDDKKAELSAFDEIGTNDYAGGRSFVYKYDKAYKEWVAAKGTANEKTKESALETALTNLETAFEKYTESKAILAKWEELKPLIHDYRDKEAENTKASAAYKAKQEYKDYTTYQGTWTTAAKAINDANTALSKVATQGFFYWDLNAQA